AYTKEELLRYLDFYGYHYFVDQSNLDEEYERNFFRNRFSNQLIECYAEGIKRSFQYLHVDKKNLSIGYSELFHEKEFYLLRYETEQIKVRLIDNYLKKLGYLLSREQRKRIEEENSLVFGHRWAVEIGEELIYIAPYCTETMPKAFKESCRVKKIPSKIRAYLYAERISLTKLLV
ncbi:MAG TPA: tRNA lysidine(34) synthetase TilS, partial [Campylobacterales bacterium]|nr:tRNA lysidine(34) synthetase TilS [Campylobacterales bacterium]